VYSLGRAEYGRLGLGKDAGEKSEPTLVPGLSDVQVIACGASVSFAVTKQGENTPCPGLDALQPLQIIINRPFWLQVHLD